MFRMYENPYKLSLMLAQARAQLEDAKAQYTEDDIDRLIDLDNEVCELEERLSCAWADDEYDEDNATDNWYDLDSIFYD